MTLAPVEQLSNRYQDSPPPPTSNNSEIRKSPDRDPNSGHNKCSVLYTSATPVISWSPSHHWDKSSNTDSPKTSNSTQSQPQDHSGKHKRAITRQKVPGGSNKKKLEDVAVIHNVPAAHTAAAFKSTSDPPSTTTKAASDTDYPSDHHLSNKNSKHKSQTPSPPRTPDMNLSFTTNSTSFDNPHAPLTDSDDDVNEESLPLPLNPGHAVPYPSHTESQGARYRLSTSPSYSQSLAEMDEDELIEENSPGRDHDISDPPPSHSQFTDRRVRLRASGAKKVVIDMEVTPVTPSPTSPLPPRPPPPTMPRCPPMKPRKVPTAISKIRNDAAPVRWNEKQSYLQSNDDHDNDELNKRSRRDGETIRSKGIVIWSDLGPTKHLRAPSVIPLPLPTLKTKNRPARTSPIVPTNQPSPFFLHMFPAPTFTTFPLPRRFPLPLLQLPLFQMLLF